MTLVRVERPFALKNARASRADNKKEITMTQRAYAHYFTGTPTEMILISGDTDAGRNIEMAITTEMALKLMVDGGKAYAKCKHVGHAIWHVKEGKMSDADFENCSSCQMDRS